MALAQHNLYVLIPMCACQQQNLPAALQTCGMVMACMLV